MDSSDFSFSRIWICPWCSPHQASKATATGVCRRCRQPLPDAYLEFCAPWIKGRSDLSDADALRNVTGNTLQRSHRGAGVHSPLWHRHSEHTVHTCCTSKRTVLRPRQCSCCAPPQLSALNETHSALAVWSPRRFVDLPRLASRDSLREDGCEIAPIPKPP